MTPRNRILFVAALAAGLARADSIGFRSGGEIQGVIVDETDADVTIKTGPGTATFKKSQLRSIFHDATANAEMKRDWQSQYFASPEFLPPSLRPLAQDFRALAGRQTAALQAQNQIARARTELTQVENQLRDLQQQNVEVAAKLQRANPAKDPDAYNNLVRANNDIVSRTTLLQNRRSQLAALDTSGRAAIAAYFTTLSSFRDSLETERAKQPAGEPSRVFFAKAGEQLAAMSAALQEVRIPMNDARGHALVSARINDRDDARLLVDTGASFVTFTAASATRLHLKWDKSQKIKMELADGKKIDVHPVTLDSLKIGDARLNSVSAVVIPDGHIEDVDGLLGMSFLREFDVQLDSARGQILLHRLPPPK